MGKLRRLLFLLVWLLALAGDASAGALKLFINLDAKAPEEALVESFYSRNRPAEILYTRDDLRLVELHFLEEDDNNPQRPFRYVDPSTWPTVKFAAGTRDLIPTGGTFTITDVDAGQTTGAIAYNAAGATVQTAIQSALTTNFGSATVSDVSTGVWSIDRVSTGAFTGELTITGTALTPAGSTGYVINTEDGTGFLSEKWQIGLARAHPILRTTGWSALPSADVTVTTVQNGSGSAPKANKVFRVRYNSDAYGGAIALAFTGDTTAGTVKWAYDASGDEVAAAFEAHTDVEEDGVSVVKNGAGDYTIELVGDGIKESNVPALATSSNTLQVPVGVRASMASNTALITSLLGSANTAAVTTEVEIFRNTGFPETVVQADSELSRDLIRNTPGSSTGLEVWATTNDLIVTGDENDLTIGNGVTGTYVQATPPSGVFLGSWIWEADISIGLQGDGTLMLPAGTESLPSLNFGGDLDTGFYLVAGNQIGIATDGTLRATWNDSGLAMGDFEITFGALGAIATRENLSAAKSGENSDITSLTNLTTPLSQAQGGTGITASGHHARVRTPGTASHQAIADATWTKLTVLTSELADLNGLWNGGSSQTAVLPAGGYFFTLCVAADNTTWELAVYDDGAVSAYPGLLGNHPFAHPRWSGFIVADGSSVYDFRVQQNAGGSRNVYDDTQFPGLVIMRVW